jgi:hypothetical protein
MRETWREWREGKDSTREGNAEEVTKGRLCSWREARSGKEERNEAKAEGEMDGQEDMEEERKEDACGDEGLEDDSDSERDRERESRRGESAVRGWSEERVREVRVRLRCNRERKDGSAASTACSMSKYS